MNWLPKFGRGLARRWREAAGGGMVWLAVFFAAMSWLFGMRLYLSPDWRGYAVCVGLAVVCGLLVPHRNGEMERFPAWLVLPLGLATWLLPWPYRTGPLLLLAGVILQWPRRGGLLRTGPAGAALLVGTVLTAQSVCIRLYEGLFTGHHDVAWLAGPFAAILRALGLRTGVQEGVIFVQTVRDTQPFRVTWEALGTLPLLLFLAGALAAFLICHRRAGRIRRFLRFGIFTIGLFLLRYLALILLIIYGHTFLAGDEIPSAAFVFWTPLWIGVSLLPAALLLGWGFRFGWRDAAPAEDDDGCCSCLASLSGGAAAVLLVLALGFQDPGRAKAGRILMDSLHSAWEPFDRPYDTTWYGHDSGYNYAAMYRFLGECYQVADGREELTDERLSEHDILILKIPTKPFAPAEQEAVERFVRRGGGLFLLGEHTNVFGSSVYLNPIARRFGFTFDYNCVFDIEHKFEQRHAPPALLPHPVVAGMPEFLFEVSCSIRPESLRVEPVVRAGGLKTLDIDYSARNFYPQVVDSGQMRFGTFWQVAARRYGKGRVVAFSDSTCYSNFSAFHQGKPEFLLGTMAWLNRTNTPLAWLRPLFWLGGLALATVALFALLATDRAGAPPRTAAWTCAAAILAIVMVDAFNRRMCPPAPPRPEPAWIAFEQEHCNYDLPDFGFPDELGRCYGIFHQWLLRLGQYPRTFRTLDRSLDHAACLVLIRPDQDFSAADLAKIEEYVEAGGKVLVLDDLTNHDSTANQVLAPFGLSFDPDTPIKKHLLMTAAGRQLISDIAETMPVQGGTPVLFDSSGRTVAACVSAGRGLVVAAALADRFTDANMGVSQGVVPDAKLAKVYGLHFALMRGLIEGRLEEALSKIEFPAVPVGRDAGDQTDWSDPSDLSDDEKPTSEEK